jgi:hypothetical protein
MDNRYFKYLLYLFVFTIGCKKRPFDYRNKYYGKWEFTYQFAETAPSYSTTKNGTELGDVYYKKHDGKNALHFNTSFFDFGTIIIDADGSFSGCGTTGEFSSRKSMQLSYNSFYCYGGHSGSQRYIVTAVKK